MALATPHAYGVQPEGNALVAALTGGPRPCRGPGLGRARVLPDELLLEALSWLDAPTLGHLGAVSRACYVFAHVDELWKALVLGANGDAPVEYEGTWRRTRIAQVTGRPPPPHVSRPVTGFYSDLLFKAHLCAAADIDPRWVAAADAGGPGALPRVSARDLPPERFAAEFDAANRPVILTDACGAWRATAAWGTPGYLAAAAGADATFDAAGFRFTMAGYLRYAASASAPGGGEDQPLYLFDPRFAEKAPALARDYAVPPHFSDDAFACLGAGRRPDHSWLIVGPLRSGSVWHVDPNRTSAFNAVLVGAKLWLMAPPDGPPPPGVVVSADGGSVATSMCPMEWMLDHWERAVGGGGGGAGRGGGGGSGAMAAKLARGSAARGTCSSARDAPGGGSGAFARGRAVAQPAAATAWSGGVPPPAARILSGVCREGEVVFVPRGWYHMVLNVECGLGGAAAVAITHNFVSRAALPAALRFLREQPRAVSGVDKARRATLGAELTAALAVARPAELAAAEAQLAAEDRGAGVAAERAAGGGVADGGDAGGAGDDAVPVGTASVEMSVRWRSVVGHRDGPAAHTVGAARGTDGAPGEHPVAAAAISQTEFTFGFACQ